MLLFLELPDVNMPCLDSLYIHGLRQNYSVKSVISHVLCYVLSLQYTEDKLEFKYKHFIQHKHARFAGSLKTRKVLPGHCLSVPNESQESVQNFLQHSLHLFCDLETTVSQLSGMRVHQRIERINNQNYGHSIYSLL